MPGNVIWHRVAEEDLSEAYLFIGSDSPDAAERLLDAVLEAVEFLLENPGAGRLREMRSKRAEGIRSWTLRRFQMYQIFYRPEGEDLSVVRFLHGARDVDRLFEDDD